MSGTQYNTGTNIVLAVNSSGGTNVGTGTIQQNTLMPSTTTPVAGVFLVSITAVDGMGNATFTIYKTDFSGVQSSTMGGPVAPGSHIDYVGPAGEFAIAFTITNNATVAGMTHQ